MRRKPGGERADGGSCGIDFTKYSVGCILGWVRMILLDDVVGERCTRETLSRGFVASWIFRVMLDHVSDFLLFAYGRCSNTDQIILGYSDIDSPSQFIFGLVIATRHLTACLKPDVSRAVVQVKHQAGQARVLLHEPCS